MPTTQLKHGRPGTLALKTLAVIRRVDALPDDIQPEHLEKIQAALDAQFAHIDGSAAA